MKSKTILIFMCVVFLMGIVSSATFDNVKSFDDKVGNYGKVTIKNWFGLTDLAELELKENSDYCIINCNAIKEIKLYKDVPLIDEVRFLTKQGDGKWIEQSIESYQFYIQTGETQKEIDDYETQCSEKYNIGNETNYQDCKRVKVGSHTEYNPIWTPYKVGEIKSAGTYILKLEGKKDSSKTVDWQITSQGKLIDDWAVWTSSFNVDLFAYYNFEDNNDFINDYDLVGNEGGGGDFVVGGIIGKGGEITTDNNWNITDTDNAFDFTGTDNATVSFWIKTLANQPSPTMIINKYEGGGTGWLFGLITDQMTASHWSTVGGADLKASSVNTNGVWNHYVLTKTPTTIILYYNGVTNNSDSTKSIPATTINVVIGASAQDGSLDFNGMIDELGFWNRPLSASEVEDLYNEGAGLTIPLSITLTSPADNYLSPLSNVEFNCSATASETSTLSNISLWHNGTGTWHRNKTNLISGTINSTIFTTQMNEAQPTLWSCSVKNTNNDEFFANENRTVSVDTIPPAINIISPPRIIDSHTIGNTLDLNWTITDLNLESCWFEYNGINTTLTCGDGNTTFITVAGQQNLTLYANDTINNLNSEFTEWSYNFLENSLTFNENVSETSSQDFEINLTTDITVLSISALLNYNGTNFTSTSSCSEGECIIFNEIDILLVETGESELHDFFWDLSIFNGTDSITITTSTNSQNVSKIHLEECNATWETQTLNFTTYDEQSLVRISPFKFGGSFEFWTGEGSIRRNNSFSINDTEINLCLSPNFTISTEAIIDYDEDGEDTNYTNRFYYFDVFKITNVSQDIFMYLLKSSSSTSFILKVQDENLLPVADALIEIHRFYPGENEFKIVQIAKTDDNGKTIGFFQTETVDYKFIIKKGGETLLETGQQKIIPETSPFTLTFNTGEDLGAPWASQGDIQNLESSLSFDKDTKIVTYTYIDSSGNFTQARLFVQKQSLTNISANTILCNETSTLSSATINCNITIYGTGFYIASSFITREGEGLDKQISFQVEDFSSVVGLLGLFFGIFLIIIASFMFRFNEIAGIWAITVTIFLVNIMGLIKFGSVFVTGLLGVAIILTWLIEK